jgi:hypothetical protein
VPVLARIFETAGMSTILVTNMPYWPERIGVPRTLAVEFPFGHLLGRANDPEMQMRVIRQALQVLETAQQPGVILHFQEEWPESFEQACAVSHPETPPPIGAQMASHIGSFLRGMQRKQS